MQQKLKDKLTALIDSNFDCETTELMSFMFEKGIISEKSLRDFLIKHEYTQMLKKQDKSCFFMRLDLADEYDVSENTVKNAIYT